MAAWPYGLEDLDRIGRGDAVPLEEEHHLADLALLRPGRGDALLPDRPDARDLAQPPGRLLDDLERLLAERLDQPLREDGPDPLDHAGAEVLLDAGDGGGNDGLVPLDLELLAELRVVGPPPVDAERLPGGETQDGADDGDGVGPAGDIQAGDDVLRLLADVGDAGDRPLDRRVGIGP